MAINKCNSIIVLSRVVGTIFIIICHIIVNYTFIPWSEYLGQFFNCGVQIFIFLSGYLYGGKQIKKYSVWFLKRILYVVVPAVLVSMIVIVVLLVIGKRIPFITIVVYFFDLEGLRFINSDLFSCVFEPVSGLGNLWFTTVIMMCYLCVPLLYKISEYMIVKDYRRFVIAFSIIGFVLSFLVISFFSLHYFVFFSIGYFLGKIRFLERINIKFFILYSICFAVLISLRVILHGLFDSSDIYITYASLSQFFIGTWFVFLIAFINNYFHSSIDRVANLKLIQYIDKYSYYLYLVHGVFCQDIFNLYNFLPLWSATLLFFACTIISAVILKYITNCFVNPLSKRVV